MKDIIPQKIVIEMNEDGTFKNGVMLYKRRIDGQIDGKTYSLAIKNGITENDVKKILDQAKSHVNLAEGV